MTPSPSRRAFLAATTVSPLVAALTPSPSAARAVAAEPFDAEALAAAVNHYAALGEKTSGGAGDNAVGQWLEDALAQMGYATSRQPFSAPGFTQTAATIDCEGAQATLIPQAPVVPTGASGLVAPIIAYPDWQAPPTAVCGAIAMIMLPIGRWSSLLQPGIQEPLRAALTAGASGVVLVTQNAAGVAAALNAPAIGPASFDRPVAIIGGHAAQPFLKLSGRTARLVIAGEVAARPAFNIIGRMERGGSKRWLVVSTPRSGWFGCAAERGPGVAIWLALARWAALAPLDVNLAFLSSSGHEYENLGSAHMLDGEVPAPADTALWLHLGAGFAARDWHEAGAGLLPLPSADPQRYLVATRPLLPRAQSAFKGLAGLEAAYPAESGTAGELTGIIKAGYPAAVGLFGAHRYHHCREDDMRCVVPPPIAAIAKAARTLIEGALAQQAPA